MENMIGTEIKGYRLIERIGAGGFGAVYKAEQTTVGREVAIKVILPGFANQPDFIRRFETEAQFVARLEHLHIVPLYDYWRDSNGAYLVMRYLKGGSLSHALQNGAFDLRTVATMLDQIAAALTVAHRNAVIHRDIKPGNILLDEDENVYLSDFGIAKDLVKEGITNPDHVIGSLDYISPEQARNEPVTPRTDIYSLGVTLYEMLTGEHPFKGSSSIERLYKHLSDPLPDIQTLDPAIREAMNAVIQKATAKDPAHRYVDVLALAAAFREGARLNELARPENIVEQLTLREHEILNLIIAGYGNKQIADKLFVTTATVKWHIKQLYSKLGVRSRVQAIIRARELDLVVTDTLQDGETYGSVPALTSNSQTEIENPYKGLRAFQSSDARDFYGRSDIVDKLIRRMSDDDRFARFLAVIGPSGSGKSSIVKAGLIPAIWQGKLPGSERWFVVEMMPGAHPLDELEIALTRIAANQSGSLNEQLSRDERGLVRAAQLILPADNSELLLVIDQFEELFTLVTDDAVRRHFLNLLLTAATDARSRIRIIVTHRADYYDRPLHYPEFGEMLRARIETVLPLGAKGLERAVTGPAERVNVTFEPGLVAQIVSEVNYQAGALPLLQYALTELFERREGRVITHAAYQAIGGAGGALANRADELYQSLDDAGREQTRQMFLRLVTPGEGAEDTRRRVPRSELLSIAVSASDAAQNTPDLLDEIIDMYADYRLLALDNDPGTRTPTVEVAHEALLREWERLREWLNESRNDIRLQRQLIQAAKEWDTAGQDESYLLHGIRLEQFELWAKDTRLAMAPLEGNYLKASIQQRRDQQAAEQTRQLHEAALESRSRTMLRLLVVVLGAAALLGIGLSVVAFDREQQAQSARATSEANLLLVERESAINRSLVLANDAERAVEGGRTELGLRLALEAMQMPEPPVESERALRTVALGPGTKSILTGHSQRVQAVAFSRDSRFALSAACAEMSENVCQMSEIILWDLSISKEIKRIQGLAGLVTGAVFALDEQSLWSAGTDGLLIQWDASPDSATFGNALQTLQPDMGAITALTLNSDGKTVFIGTDSGAIAEVDLSTSAILQRYIGHAGRVNSVAVSPDGTQIASGADDKSIILWDAASGELVRRFEGHTNAVTQVAFNPLGGTLLSSSADFSLRLWDIATGAESRSQTHPVTVNGFAIHPDGHTALVDYGGGALILLDLDQWQITRYLFNNPTGLPTPNDVAVSCFTYDPSGSFALTGTIGGSITVWSMGQSRKVFQYEAPGIPNDYANMTIRADGQRMLVGSAESGDAILWNIDPASADYRTILKQFSGYKGLGMIALMQFSPDGKIALIASADWLGNNLNNKTAILWDVDEQSPTFGEILYTLDGFTYFPRSAAFTDDGKFVLMGTQDLEGHGEIVMWDVATGEITRHINTLRDISSILITPDNKRALTTSAYFNDLVEWNIDPASPDFGSEIRRIPTGGYTFDVIWGTVGKTILVAENSVNIKERDYETGALVREFNGASAWKIDISPDRHYVAAGLDGGVFVVSDYQTGATLWQQDKLASFVFYVRFSADSQTLFTQAFGGPPLEWQVAEMPLDKLMTWIQANRYLRDFTCEERATYRITPLCDSATPAANS
jgi:serine/threonine protein kinase/WD40 repeat protein